jgi:hypothetical protein
MLDEKARYAARSLVEVIRNYKDWSADYSYQKDSGEFLPKKAAAEVPDLLERIKPV